MTDPSAIRCTIVGYSLVECALEGFRDCGAQDVDEMNDDIS